MLLNEMVPLAMGIERQLSGEVISSDSNVTPENGNISSMIKRLKIEEHHTVEDVRESVKFKMRIALNFLYHQSKNCLVEC